MKKMELKIAVTAICMFMAMIVMSGVYSKYSLNSNFLTRQTLALGLAGVFSYLALVWAFSRKYEILCLFFLTSALALEMLISDNELLHVEDPNGDFGVALTIYLLIILVLSIYQGHKLKHEEIVDYIITLPDGINLEDADIDDFDIKINHDDSKNKK